MITETVEPNAFTLSAVLKSCTLAARKALHCHAHKFGLESDTYVRTALIDVYARGGDVVSAHKLFDTMLDRNLVSATAMITGYAKNGNIDEARVLFDGMEKHDVVSWNVMINGYAQHGKPNEALNLFRQMMKAKLKPNKTSMLAALSACGKWAHWNLQMWEFGQLDEAYELITSANVEADPVLWETLLSACKLHKNVVLAEKIVEFLVKCGIANSRTYVLLSNIYAAIGNWYGLVRMRSMMKQRGVHKEPGCSSVEVNNKVHECFAGDMKHPKREQVYEMLYEMNKMLKTNGFVSQTEEVLHDIGEV